MAEAIVSGSVQSTAQNAAPPLPVQREAGGPLVAFGREICGDLEAALRREWLVTNGLGGYASGTLAGIATRRYHGLLVAALTPPVGRTVLVGALDEQATYDGGVCKLSAHEFAGGTIDPQGFRYLQSFHLEGMLPVWTFALGDALLERRVWMAQGQNTTYVCYRLLRGTHSLELHVTPLVTYRDFHSLTSGQGWQPAVQARPRGAEIVAFSGARPFRLLADGGEFTPSGGWWWNFHHREETARGLDDRSDLFAPGQFSATLWPGALFTLVLTTESSADLNSGYALAMAEARQIGLIRDAGAGDPFARQLVLAADQFLARRGGSQTAGVGHGGDTASASGNGMSVTGDDGTTAAPAGGRTVIAGFHWFNDWGRDTMISLPGLALSTGRAAEAADVLRTFARYIESGLCPNNFPDDSGLPPSYNTADATLWYVLAVRAYCDVAGSETLIEELLPALHEIVERHRRGTGFGIGMDQRDGLLQAGAPGLQLTWMDAKVGDWVVTPRAGKPVEINALWYNVLRIAAAIYATRDPQTGSEYAALADRVRDSFRTRFVRPDSRHLADVVDGPNGDDFSERPNQIFAVSLPNPLLEGAVAAGVVDAVGRDLLTSGGLRSLAPAEPAYQGGYGGDQTQRDGAYHQGTVWAWLLGPYAEAHYRVYRDAHAALALLRPLEDHLRDAGLGTISEIFDGDPPHTPRGCIAQAWSVAETLRVWRKLSAATKR
ncbi:MAG TPA: amylo-alpha-1,6-glucosidase [Dehalococcoidia bacterium]|nr:amylo-alpha-1,6-glucosidase [Dehalococcoidia bacterium]